MEQTDQGGSQPRITRPTSVSASFDRSQTDPCRPNPCGPNTQCETNNRGIALCKCLPDYVPDGNTINGCKFQCVRWVTNLELELRTLLFKKDTQNFCAWIFRAEE